MNVIEVDVGKTKLFSIGQQYNSNALVIHFVNLPNRKNKYIYYKIDDIEEEIPLVSDLFIVSRPLMLHSGEVKAQIITRDESNSIVELTNNFTMRIKPSNYSGIGEDERYPDDPNVKNYFVKIDEKLNSFEELANLVQTKLDNGEFVGAQGPKGDPGEKGDPGDVTEEYRNLANQIAQNASDAQASATNAQTSASNAQKALNDTKEFANQTKTELNQIKTDTSALKEEANTSAVNAKSSETKAKEYANNLQASTDDISQLKEDLAELNNSVDVIPKFIKNTVIQFTEPGIINALDGSIRTDVGTCTTLVEIPQRTKLYWSMASKTPQTGYLYIAFYDANMKYISDIGVPTGTDNPTSGIIDLSLNEYRKAKYVRGSINNKIDYIVSNCIMVFSGNAEISEDNLSLSLSNQLQKATDNANKVYLFKHNGEIDSEGLVRPFSSVKKITDEIPLKNVAKLSVCTMYSGNTVFFYTATKRCLKSLTVQSKSNSYFDVPINDEHKEASYCIVCGYDVNSVFDENTYFVKAIMTNPNGETKFNEKKMLVFGDSITDSAEISIDDNMCSNKYLPRKADANGKKMWVNIIKDMYAFSDVRNYALSGATWRKINNNPRANAPSQIELALNDMNNPNGVFPTSSFIPDIVIFALGINDGITPSDSYESAMDKTIYIKNTKNIDLDATIANLDVTKFNESVRYSLLTIKKNFPLATVFVSLPLQCMKEQTVSTSKLVDDIRKMAKRCGCLVIESTSESGIIPEGNFYNSDKEGITLLDGLHPNASGQKLLARCILKDLLTKYIPINFV